MIKRVAFWLGAFLLASAAVHAQEEQSPLVFTRTQLEIIRQQPPQGGGASQKLEVDVRDANSFYHQEGWFNLSNMAPDKGVLLVFPELVLAPITYMRQYAPLDILMVNEQGKITQIFPSLILNNLDTDLYPEIPVRAFLLLSGGTCERLSIKPGDEIRYSLFKKPPVTLVPEPENKTPPPQAEQVPAPAPSATGTQTAAPPPAPASAAEEKSEITIIGSPPGWRPPATQPEGEKQVLPPQP